MSIRVMTRVWDQSKQQGSALVVLLAIADFASDTGLAYPSVATLAEKARVSESQIHWILRKLQEEDELTIERNAGPHRCNLYFITGDRVLTSEGAAGNSERVRPVAPKPSIEPSEGTPVGPSSDSEESSSLPPGNIDSSKNEISDYWEAQDKNPLQSKVAAPEIQEWYAILQKTKPFTEDWLEVEAARVKHGISEELALEKAYAVQTWWPTAPARTRKEGNTFFHWRNWCIKEPKHASPKSPSKMTNDEGDAESKRVLAEKQRYDEGMAYRLARDAEIHARTTGSGGGDD